MNKLAVVIPHYMGFDDKAEMLAKCIVSLKGHDALFVVGQSDKNLPWTINRGFGLAAKWEATHMLLISDDMELVSGDLSMLVHDEYVTHPLINGIRDNNVLGGAMCMPMEVIYKLYWEDMHFYDENFIQGYYDDDDIFHRMSKYGIERRIVTTVDIAHPNPGATLTRLDFNAESNKDYFEAKHEIVWKKWELPPDLESE